MAKSICSVLLLILPMALTIALTPAMPHCPHGVQAAQAGHETMPCCPLQAVMGAACALACQPAIAQATPGEFSPEMHNVSFVVAEQRLAGRSLQPPEPPPRSIL
jgi:hypothetical protein